MAFLVFEGLDGSGKSTLMRRLCEKLKSENKDFHVTREPGGTELGEELRKIVLRVDGDVPTPKSELLIYQAIRAHHVDTIIRPKIEQGIWVLSDRFTASSLAFQTGGRGLKQSDTLWLNEFSTSGLKPDLIVLLDLPIEESERRMKGRVDSGGEAMDRFELEKKDFHMRVRQNYLTMAQADPERWLVLDATKSPELLFKELVEKLKERQWLAF